MDYAIIKDGKVDSVIVADDAFIAEAGDRLGGQAVPLDSSTYDKGQRPGPGWLFNKGTGKFSRPVGA